LSVCRYHFAFNTKFEEEDIGFDTFSGQFYTVFHEDKCIQPIGESKSDYEIVCLIAEKLGLYEKIYSREDRRRLDQIWIRTLAYTEDDRL